MSELNGKIVAVMGASSGMGRATALRFAEKGAKVLLGARSSEKLDELAQEITSSAGEALYRAVDVRQRDQVESWFDWAVKEAGQVNVLVYATGTNAPNRAVNDVDVDTWNEIIETNLTGAFHCTQGVLPSMLEAKDGLIIYISSVSAKRADGSGIAYQASKRGLDGLAFGMLGELKASGIRATVIYPALTHTPLMQKRPQPPSQEVIEKALRPEDVAEACLFVAALPARVNVPEIVLSPTGLQEPVASIY